MPDRASERKLLVIADSTVLRAGLRSLLHAPGDMSVVGEAASVTRAIDLGQHGLRPDALVVDVRDPRNFDVEQCRQLQRELPGCPILVVTPSVDGDTIWELVAYHASGYFCEDAPAEELREAVRTVCRGGVPVCPRISAVVAARLRTCPPEPEDPAEMTAAELDVLIGIQRGETNREIAHRLGLDVPAVKRLVSTILRKIHVTNRAAAAAWCARHRGAWPFEAVDGSAPTHSRRV